jgi:hypothetical protein
MFMDCHSVKVAIRDKTSKTRLAQGYQARRILLTRTGRETIERALDLVLAEALLVRVLRRGNGTGGL